jgi:hypothetical protein
MSSYDNRTRIQIKIDELLLKYKRRLFDYEKNQSNDDVDIEIYKQLKIVYNDLNEIKNFLDMEAVKKWTKNSKELQLKNIK